MNDERFELAGLYKGVQIYSLFKGIKWKLYVTLKDGKIDCADATYGGICNAIDTKLKNNVKIRER